MYIFCLGVFQSSEGEGSTSTTGSRSLAPYFPRPMTRELSHILAYFCVFFMPPYFFLSLLFFSSSLLPLYFRGPRETRFLFVRCFELVVRTNSAVRVSQISSVKILNSRVTLLTLTIYALSRNLTWIIWESEVTEIIFFKN